MSRVLSLSNLSFKRPLHLKDGQLGSQKVKKRALPARPARLLRVHLSFAPHISGDSPGMRLLHHEDNALGSGPWCRTLQMRNCAR